MSVSAPDDAFLDVNDAHLRVYGNVHADGLKLGQLEVVTTTSTGSTIQFLHQHTAFTTTSNIDVGTTNHELFVDTNLSRVGILTNTPTTALDVNGTVTATAFAGDGANLTGIPSSAINGTLSQWTTVTGPKIHYSDGNVGVGVADPAFKLDVDGDINFTGTLREDGNPFVSTPWTIESGPTALSYTGGNVGIGAGTPSAKLEVTGNAHVSTDLSVGGTLSINTITAAATHALSAVTAVGASTGDTIQLTHATTGLVTTANVEVGKDLTVTGNVTASTFSDGTAQLTGGTWSGSAARLTTAVDIGGVAFDGSASIVPTTFGAATFSGDVTVDTDTLYVDSTNNRVLIGTTTPYYSQRFEVSGGNSRFAGGVYSRSQFKRFNYNFSTSGNNNHTLTIPINGANARGIMKLKINVVQVAPNASSASIAELEGYISAYGGTHGITATKGVRANSLYAEHICSSTTSSSGDLKIYYQPIEGYQQSVYVAFDIELQLGATFANAGSLSHALSSSNTGVTQSSPHMVINTNGRVGIGITNPRPTFEVYNSGLGTGVRNDTGKIFAVQSDSTSWTSGHALTGINMKANVGSGGRFLQCNTGFASTGVSGSFDAQFILYEEGTGTAEISWNGGGADYAEYFEWKDGNPDNEDRVGMTVKLNGDKIELVTETDDANSIIGAISANPGFVGDNAGLKWKNKYLRDDFGRLLMEEYEVYAWKDENGDDQIHGTNEPVPEDLNIPEDRIVKTTKRRILNPEFDPNAVYVSRDDRKEWCTVGLVGKLRIRKDQPIHPKWILLRDISENVKEWLIK